MGNLLYYAIIQNQTTRNIEGTGRLCYSPETEDGSSTPLPKRPPLEL